MMDWLAAIFGLIGLWLLSEKYKHGFTLGIVSDILWIIIGLQKGLPGLVTVCVILIGVNIRGYLKWQKK